MCEYRACVSMHSLVRLSVVCVVEYVYTLYA